MGHAIIVIVHSSSVQMRWRPQRREKNSGPRWNQCFSRNNPSIPLANVAHVVRKAQKTQLCDEQTRRYGHCIFVKMLKIQPPSRVFVRSRNFLIKPSAPPEAMIEANSSRRVARSLIVPLR